MVEMLIRHRDLVIEDSDTVTQGLTLFRTRPALGFSDCLMRQLARKAGHIPLGTFDRNLGKIDGAQRI
jgi:predicted nucleic-acid-binding protein